MKYSRKKMILPSLTFLFAVGLAFATATAPGASDVAAPIDGYIDNSQPCTQPPVACQTDGEEICVDGNEQQVKAFNAAGTSCNVEVYRLEL